MVELSFVPVNECGVFYYFSKYHKELGFDKIVKLTTQFPDVTASYKDEIMRIELEYKLSSFNNHYKVADKGHWANEFRWNDDRNVWQPYNKIYNTWDYPMYKSEQYKYIVGETGNLEYKTLLDQCDCVICWITDTIIRDNIKVINLKDFLTHLP